MPGTLILTWESFLTNALLLRAQFRERLALNNNLLYLGTDS
jgi:hypothetical protein